MNNIKEVIEYIRNNQWLLALAGTIMIPLIIIFVGKTLDFIIKVLSKSVSILFGNKVSYNLLFYWTFIGVIHHELSHALFGFLSGARIIEMNLYKPNKKTGELGHVVSVPRGNIFFQGLQKALVSIAPVVMGFIEH